LIADDLNLFAKTLEAMLAGEPSIEVIGRAANGKQAIALARTLRPDLILMDIFMPVLDGLEATRFIHRLDPSIDVLVLTASHSAEDAQEAWDCGAVGYLTKDRIATQLVPAILELASRRQPPAELLTWPAEAS